MINPPLQPAEPEQTRGDAGRNHSPGPEPATVADSEPAQPTGAGSLIAAPISPSTRSASSAGT